MANVLIHRCTLRVVRRGGWSWSNEPRRIAQDAVRVLPALLARKLSEMLLDDDDREISAPICLCLSSRLSELSELSDAASSSADTWPGIVPSSPLDQKIASAVSAAFEIPGPDSASRNTPPPDQNLVETTRDTPLHAPVQQGGALIHLLLEWHRQGFLQRRLAALSGEQLISWYRQLHCASKLSSATPDPILHLQIDSFARTNRSFLSHPDPAERIRRCISIAVDVSLRLRLPLTHHALWCFLDDLVSAPPSRTTPSSGSPPTLVAAFGPIDSSPKSVVVTSCSPSAPAKSVPRTAQSSSSAEWSMKIDCALPFLLLGPLARVGYLDTLTAVLEAAELGDHARSFATALAYKVLEPPQRGWRRGSASSQIAAAMAGLTTPIGEDSLVTLARRMASHTGALDLVLTDSLVAGHSPGEPVILHFDPAMGYLLFDLQGCFPIESRCDLQSILALLKRLDAPVVLISSDAANTSILRELDASGIIFVVDVPPTRSEVWCRIQQGTGFFGWTNSSCPNTAILLHAAHDMEKACEEARGLLTELVLMRPGVIRAPTPELDRSLTLASSFAMGTIAWTLWRARGRTTPQQVLERFADLGAWVHFDPSLVKVVLPLGRRYRELSQNGFLSPIIGVPWLGERRIEFGGG